MLDEVISIKQKVDENGGYFGRRKNDLDEK